MVQKKNSLIVRRLIGAILLALFAMFDLGYCLSLMQDAWVGIVRQFQLFLYFYGAWSIGISIWYFVTLTKAPNKTAELIIKIIFSILVLSNVIYSAAINYSNATALGIVLLICYAIGCPWGPAGYKNNPYPSFLSRQNVRPWYQAWWFWLTFVLAVVVAIFLGFVIDGDLNKNTVHLNQNGTVERSPRPANEITVSYHHYRIKAIKTYQVNYDDQSWSGGSLRISKIKVYQTARPYLYSTANDGRVRAQGFIRIYMTVHAKDDINVEPTDGTYSYSDGEQYEADAAEDWDGDLNRGVIKSGTITLPVQKLSSVKALKNIRMKFDVSAQDSNDDSLDKTMDRNIALK